jgi:autotransporter translocation and assembly factor TamB
VFGQPFQDVSGNFELAADRHLTFDLKLAQAPTRAMALAGELTLHPDNQGVGLTALTADLGGAAWRLERTDRTADLRWDSDGITIAPLTLVSGTANDERIALSGSWRDDDKSVITIQARHVFLETLQGSVGRPTRYGGVLDADVEFRKSRNGPAITANVTVTNGRVERVSYDKLAGHVKYGRDLFDIDVRLDQTQGVWMTATGTVPRALFERDLPDQPMNVVLRSSTIDLGLLEGLTDVVRSVTGTAQFDVTAVGTSREPRFDGSITVDDAGFLVAPTGVRYKNARASFNLVQDRVEVNSIHVEDSDGRALDMRGSLSTRELQVTELGIDVIARRFEVLRNELGRVNIDADLKFRGRFDAPRATGTITVDSGEVKVAEIIERAFFRPYATEPIPTTTVDAVRSLRLWDRVGFDVTVTVPQALRLAGTDVRLSADSPIGIGDVSLRAGGELYLYKDPDRPLSITGSLYRLSGNWTFQSRRFGIDESSSSINFHGDTNPELYVVLTRPVSGIEARLTISGMQQRPELTLSSQPALEPSDILSLVLFNATPNQLTTEQQQELAIRAGTLAAGFLAAPLVSALENQLGLELQLEPSAGSGTGPRVTIGNEIAPGLVATVSREFSQDPFDEITLEYYLSRLLRLRATFSDAQTLNLRSPFRRVERAGIDLLVFFSF